MSARIVIDYIIETKGININTLTDKDFSNISWLREKEAIYNANGEKVSKSYYYEDKEAIRIVYAKNIGDYKYDGVVYPDTYTGVNKVMQWIDWAGEIAYEKEMQPFEFDLKPIYDTDGVTITGFTSLKLREFNAKEELRKTS